MTENAKTKRVTVAAVLDPNTFQALENYRWPARLKMSELLNKAISEFMETHNIVVDSPDKV